MTIEAGPAGPEQKVPHRALITGLVMLATLMQVLDSTIATVALPYMQGSMSASADEITWVLTSYVAAAAVMTAPVGWMARRFGRKTLFITCLIGFTIASMMCGAAQTLGQIVVFRIVQGMCGAAMVPLSQATMLDIYPFEMRAQAMAIFGIGIMVGPIMGPTVGGWLTDTYNWRWVFYVNLPLGIIAVTGLAIFMPRSSARAELRFDWMGFAVLALGLGCLQMMLDRGEDQDWFTSREIITEAVLAGLGFYLFVVHMFTADRPFLPTGVFRDRNFAAAALMMFCTGMVLLATSALLSPYLQTLADYPVSTAGLALAPRGFGTMVSMLLAARLAKYIDQRLLMAFGLLLLGWNLQRMSGWTPDISGFELTSGLVTQGFAVGFIFNPMTVMAFTTLPTHLRGDATAVQNLTRNIGSAIGISITSSTLAHSTQVLHADLVASITPFQRELQGHGLTAGLLDPATGHGSALLDQMINRQAEIIAYSNDFWMMSFVVILPLALLLLMRGARRDHRLFGRPVD
jgi:DHA2 family multidrug resistance protein